VNRKEFLRKLQLELYKLPRHEIDDAIAYYNEYFEEAGPEQEQAVIKDLGSPSKIATQIKADYAVRQLESMESGRSRNAAGRAGADYAAGSGGSGSAGYGNGNANYTNQKPPGKISAAWWVVIGIVGGIFAAPVAIPVAVTLAALLIGLFVGILALLIAALVTTIVLIVLSVVAVIVGLTLLATSAPLAVLVIGLGLMGISTMALLTVGIIALTNAFFRFIARKHREGQVKRAQKREEKLRQNFQAGQEAAPDVQATTMAGSDAAPGAPAATMAVETAAAPAEVAAASVEDPVEVAAQPMPEENITVKGGDKDEQ